MKLFDTRVQTTCYMLILIASCLIISCNRADDVVARIPLDIYVQLPPTVTAMDKSSIISLPEGVMEAHIVINSEEELRQNIPSQILTENPEYHTINFDCSSLLMIKFRLFYELHNIEYNLYIDNTDAYVVQNVSVVNKVQPEGFFVMTCIVTEKMPIINELIIEQAYHFL